MIVPRSAHGVPLRRRERRHPALLKSHELLLGQAVKLPLAVFGEPREVHGTERCRLGHA